MPVFFKSMSSKITSLPTWVNILCISFFVTLIVTPESYRYSAVTLSILALVTLHKTKHAFAKRELQIIAFSLLVYFLAYIIEMVVFSQSTRTIDLPSRTAFASLCLGLLYLYPPRFNWVVSSIACGAIIAGLIANYFSFQLDSRAFASHGYMVIQVGGICAWFGVLSLIGFFYYWSQKKTYQCALTAIGSLMGLFATLLSGARGAWVLTPFILLMITWHYRSKLNYKHILVAFIAIFAIGLLAAPQIKSRVSLIMTDLEQYSENVTNTSSGARIEMWKSAIYTGLQHPILGVGRDGIAAEKQLQISQHLISPTALRFERAHNQYLEELQTKGLVGLISLLVMFLVPLQFFYRRLKKAYRLQSEELKAISLLGSMHILMIMGFCLTQHYLNHHSGIIIYSFGLVIFAALAVHIEEQIEEQTSGEQLA